MYRTDVQRLLAAAPALAARHPPREALCRWLDELAAYGRVKRGVSRLVLAAATRDAIAQQWRPLVLGHGASRCSTPEPAPVSSAVISTPRTSGRCLGSSGRSHYPQNEPNAS